MKQFVFTLQQWYDMQTGMEKQHKQQLAAIEKQIQNLRNDMQQLTDRFDTAKHEYCGALSTGLMALRAGDYGRYFDNSKAQMANIQTRIDLLERDKEQWLQKLVRVRRELKLLDKLREKQYKAYLEDVKKEHGRFIDDMVSYRVTVS